MKKWSVGSWYNAHDEDAHWDATDIQVEVQGATWHLSGFVAILPDPDERTLYSLDVADGSGGIRSLGTGFSRTMGDAKAAVVIAIRRIAEGLKAI